MTQSSRKRCGGTQAREMNCLVGGPQSCTETCKCHGGDNQYMPACVLAAICHSGAVGVPLLQMEASIQELAEGDLQARLAGATAARDEAATGAERAATAVEAAQRELAGAEAGDGRNESNQSLQEQLEGAQNAQVRWLRCTV